MADNTVKVSEVQKRTVACPNCGARRGHPCKGSRIPGPNTFGGGWGGPPDLDRAHSERRAAYLKSVQGISCKACGMELINATNTECPNTNSYEHDFPGFNPGVILVKV